jgi:hypothetical protein
VSVDEFEAVKASEFSRVLRLSRSACKGFPHIGCERFHAIGFDSTTGNLSLTAGANGSVLSVSSGSPAWTGPITQYQMGAQSNGLLFDGGTADELTYATVTIPVAVSFSNLTVIVTTADSNSNNYYAWGQYSSSGGAICTIANTTLPSTGPVEKPCTQSVPVLVTPGTYIVAIVFYWTKGISNLRPGRCFRKSWANLSMSLESS